MIQKSTGNKKGQQLIMPMARTEDNPNCLNGYNLKVIDINSEWEEILETIYENKIIQLTMEKSYQDFQEGFKLKDFKHRNGKKGIWYFKDIKQGIYPYTLTTTDWVIDYEQKEWEEQASNNELKALYSINNAINTCKYLTENTEIINKLEFIKNKLLFKYPPRPSKPESWRPQNASHWSSKWMKVLAEIKYQNLSNDWRLIASNSHSIVAGFGSQNTIYLIDIILLTTNPDKIVKKLKE